jgi:hypothetical protein
VVLAMNTCSGCKLMKIEIQLASRYFDHELHAHMKIAPKIV